jgi:hypothetical protein
VTAWLRRHPASALGVAVSSPLILAAIVLLWRPWVPVLDMAMTEFRVRDVGGRFTPLVGLPGRIGDFPDQGSHPGPWSFYLVAPFYRLAGSTAWGMELASIAINTACVGTIGWLGHRRFGLPGATAFAALAAVAVRGYGLTVLTHPWNPYFPVLLWMVALIATWFVLIGDHWMAPLATGTSVIAAQTHVSYLVIAIALNALLIGVLLWAIGARSGDRRRRTVRTLVATLGIAGVLWVPPVVEQLRDGRPDGNIAKLIRHFATDQPEQPIGLDAASRLVLQHFDVVAIARDLVVRDDALVHRAGQLGGFDVTGLVTLLAWGAAAGWAVRRRHRELLALHAVVLTVLVAGWFSISRIFGKVWFYLTLWMSATVLLAVLSIAWTAWLIVRDRPGAAGPTRRHVAGAGLAVCAVVSGFSIVAAARHQVPENDLAQDVRVVMPTVTAALDAHLGAATGKDGSYVVFWQEAVVPGAQGYALMNELERRGYRVGVHPTWHVPATEHRVRRDGEYDAEVHLVSGSWIDVWRTREGYVEVVAYDDRTPAERERFDELEQRVVGRLTEIGRGDLIDVVDTNIFGASLTPGLPDDIVADLGEMLQLGEPVAVFIAPAGSTF